MKQVIIVKYVKWPVTYNDIGYIILNCIWNGGIDLIYLWNYKFLPDCYRDRKKFQERETKLFLVTRLKTSYHFFPLQLL